MENVKKDVILLTYPSSTQQRFSLIEYSRSNTTNPLNIHIATRVNN